jgi:hypothetical protein
MTGLCICVTKFVLSLCVCVSAVEAELVLAADPHPAVRALVHPGGDRDKRCNQIFQSVTVFVSFLTKLKFTMQTFLDHSLLCTNAL